MKVSRQNDETGEVEQIDLSPWGVARYVIFRDATRKQIGFAFVTLWRLIIGVTVLVMWGFAEAAGWPPPWVKLNSALESRILKREIRDIEDSLIEALRAKCTAANKAFSSKRLRELKDDYRRAAKSEWPEPGCDEI